MFLILLSMHDAIDDNKICVPFSTTGQWLYAFDLSSIRLCSYAPKHATIMGWFEVKTPPTASFGLCDGGCYMPKNDPKTCNR